MSAAAQPTERVREGFRHLAEGRFEQAEREGEGALAAAPEDPFAWHLLGLACLKQGRAPEAVARLEGAVRREPASVPAWLDLGNARLAAGQAEGAEAAFAEAARLRPGSAAAHHNLGVARCRAGRYRQAARDFARAAVAAPTDYASMQACVDALAAHVRAGGEVAPAPRPERRRAPLTVAFASPDAARLEAARSRLAASLEGTGSELLPVLAPRSLAAAYNEVARRAAHDRVVFLHDDVAFVSEAPWEVLAAALDHVDVVGLAGAERAAGPAVLWAGHPHVHGWVSYPAREGGGLEAAPLSLRHGLIRGIETLDGVVIAARRAAVLAVGFDERTFDGFHFYDLDFSVRAHGAGLALAVTTDVLAVHASRGNFGEAWKTYRDRFAAKFPRLSAPAGDPHWYAAPLGDAARLAAFHAELAAVGREVL